MSGIEPITLSNIPTQPDNIKNIASGSAAAEKAMERAFMGFMLENLNFAQTASLGNVTDNSLADSLLINQLWTQLLLDQALIDQDS